MRQCLKLITTLLVISSVSTFAVTVNDIIVRSTTNEILPEGMIKTNMALQNGDEFTPEKLSLDIKTLYLTKQFDDIEAKVEPVSGGMVNILLKVKPKVRVSKIIFHGNIMVSSSRLTESLSQKIHETLDEKLLTEDLQGLYDLYHNKGYSDTIINQQVIKNENSNNVEIVYDIDEKARYKTKEIEIIGNTIFPDRQLQKLMETDVSFWGRIFPVGFFNETELKNDLDKIKQIYWNNGYLDFKIENVERNFNSEADKIYLAIYLLEGSQYYVGTTSISGNVEFETDILQSLLSLKPNELFKIDYERRDVQTITNKYNQIGYLDCYVYVDKIIDSENKTVKINIVINEGESSSIRDINISGNKVTKDYVIRRELRIHPGDLSDSRKINSSKSSLLNLGYFDKVDIIPVSTDNPEYKDLNVKVNEKLTGQLLFGAGFSSTDSILGTIEVAQSNFDVKNYPTFRGGGQRFRLRAQLGSSRKDFILSFTEPWLMEKPLRFDYELWRRETSSNRDYDQDSSGTSLNFTRKLEKPFWRQSFGYRLEEIDINDIELDFSNEFFREEEGSELISALSLGFIRDHRDRVVLTSSGSRLSIRTELQSEAIGSYTNLYKFIASGDKYLPIFKQSVLKLSGEIAQAVRISGDQIKVFDRFFAGGANSIRGFKERDASPVDPSNREPVGGRSMMLASAEMTGPIYGETIFWSLFADSGSVWEESAGWNFSELNVGIGAGLRLFLPIGAIQLDYGWPVVREFDHLNNGGRFHFNLGYNF